MEQQFDAAAGLAPADDTPSREGAEHADRKSWFAVGRGVMDHPVIGEHAPTPKAADHKRRAWTYAEAWLCGIIENTAFRRHVRRDADGSERVLDAGQLLASRRYLARKFNWSESAVRVFLGKLSKAGMIVLSAQPAPPTFRSQGRGQGSNVVTVCNYKRYQHGPKARSQGHSQPPADLQPKENNKLKHSPLTPQGAGSDFDDRKREQQRRVAKPSTGSQLQPWQDPDSLAMLEKTKGRGAVARMVRQAVKDNRGQWPAWRLGPAPGTGEDNAYFAYLEADELARWAPKFDEAEPDNVVPFAPRVRRELEGAPL